MKKKRATEKKTKGKLKVNYEKERKRKFCRIKFMTVV